MVLMIVLTLLFFGSILLKAFITIYFPNSGREKSFKEGFDISDSIVSISIKGRIDNILYIDKKQNLAIYCNQVKKKTNILKEFYLKDIKKVSPFQETSIDEKDKNNIYVKTFGLKIKLYDHSEVLIYYMNDTTYVIKPNFVYETSCKLRNEHLTLFKKKKRNAS